MFDRFKNPFGGGGSDERSDLDRDHRIEIRCPETGELIATEHTDPDEWDQDVTDGEGIATYECPECGGEHRYLWGPPVPLRVDDDEDEDELLPFGDE